MTHYNEEDQSIEIPEKVEDIMFRLNLRKGDKFTDICRPKKKVRDIVSHEIIELDMSMEAIRKRAKLNKQ